MNSNANGVMHPVRLAALLALLAMFGPFAIDAFFPAFHSVAAELGATDFEMQQTISVYLISYAVMSLLHGPLSDTYGRRIVMLWGVIVYTLASVGCALAPTIEWLLFFRMIQGFSTGAGLIVGRALVRDVYDGAEALKVQSLVTLFFGIAPVVAPIIGGIVYEAAGWHSVFWFLALYGAALSLLCLRALPETHPRAARTAFRPRPLFHTYKQIGSDLRFFLLALASGCNFSAFFLYISSAPNLIERLLGLGTYDYVWFFGPGIAGTMTGATLANRLAGRVPPRRTAAIGYAVMVTAVTSNLAYCLGSPTFEVPWAVLPIALMTVGISMTFPTLSLKMLDRYPRQRGAASSVQAFIWGVITSSVAAFLSPALSWSASALSLGAASLVLVGFASWCWYAKLTPTGAAAATTRPKIDEPMEPA